MPLETQGKIVRVLQDQNFQRVGGSTRVEVDVRVIASTNRALAAEMAAGRFRQDLFYRLNVVPIRIHPLLERRDDLPLLLRYFLARSTVVAGLPARAIGDDPTSALTGYTWPATVRSD